MHSIFSKQHTHRPLLPHPWSSQLRRPLVFAALVWSLLWGICFFIVPDPIAVAAETEQAVLTTVWETVGSGRINRKYLNGLVAFCFDEDLSFPNGSLYVYAVASDATVTGQAAAIVERYGRSGVDNAQWWSECQVAIWAVLAGHTDRSSAGAFARSYCADRKITDAATVEDYVQIVGALVEESRGQSGTAYLYQAADPANQRILTFTPVWPNPEPAYPSPRYDQVSVTEGYTAVRTHSISLSRKYAAITGELLRDAVFEVYEEGILVGTITTDAQGTGSCSWTLSAPGSSTITKEYCSNYDQLDPSILSTITGYTNRDAAYAAAQAEAQAAARTQAETLADTPRTVTIRESTVPIGFSCATVAAQTISLTGNDSASVSVENTPWKATFHLDKVDGVTGQRIEGDATFAFYEWNGSSYEISPHYQVIRLEDGTYTVAPSYPDGQQGYLYYTQQNQGRFGLAELQAPDGYYIDPQISYFEIQQDGQILTGHNAVPEDYPIQDPTRFANQPKPQPHYDTVSATAQNTATRTHQLFLDRKTAAVTSEPIAGAVFQVYEDGLSVGILTTDAQGTGRCQWEVSATATATVTERYCTNYNRLEPEEQATVTTYTSLDDALAAAQSQANAQAQALAEEAAEAPHTVSVEEISVPTGFRSPAQSLPEWTLSGEDSATFSAENIPWSASFLLDKVDGVTGHRIKGETTFALYEWNGSDYEISPHYQVIRLEDGTYTVSAFYPDSQVGCLYYTLTNEGRFALAEIQAPHGYVQDRSWLYFQITEDQQTILGHNAVPEDYPICDPTRFANQPVTGTIEIRKQGDYLIGIQDPDPTDKLPEKSSHKISDESSVAPSADASWFTPFQYETGAVEGTVFSLYAAENILLPDGSEQIACYRGIPLVKDALVATVSTDIYGLARVEGLPLGTYYIQETSPGQGPFLRNPTIFSVTLSYTDQNTPVIVDPSPSYHNQRQRISLTLTKKDQSSNAPLSGAVYGLYASDDICGYTIDEETGAITREGAPFLAADTLIECVITDADGRATFLSDLPNGSYYIRELIPPTGYLLSEEILTVDARYIGPDEEPVFSLEHTVYDDPIPVPPPSSDTPLPSSNGAPTGDTQSLLFCWLGVLVSGFVLFLFHKKARRSSTLSSL